MLYLGPKSFDNQAATLEQVLLFTFGVMRDKYFQSKTVFAQKHRSTAKNFSEMGKILLILPHPILHRVQSNAPQLTTLVTTQCVHTTFTVKMQYCITVLK